MSKKLNVKFFENNVTEATFNEVERTWLMFSSCSSDQPFTSIRFNVFTLKNDYSLYLLNINLLNITFDTAKAIIKEPLKITFL